MKKIIFGVSYVSIWIIVWGSIGSFIDFPLLQIDLYKAGSIGQISTFTLTAIISIILARNFFSKVKSMFNIENA